MAVGKKDGMGMCWARRRYIWQVFRILDGFLLTACRRGSSHCLIEPLSEQAHRGLDKKD